MKSTLLECLDLEIFSLSSSSIKLKICIGTPLSAVLLLIRTSQPESTLKKSRSWREENCSMFCTLSGALKLIFFKKSPCHGLRGTPLEELPFWSWSHSEQFF